MIKIHIAPTLGTSGFSWLSMVKYNIGKETEG